MNAILLRLGGRSLNSITAGGNLGLNLVSFSLSSGVNKLITHKPPHFNSWIQTTYSPVQPFFMLTDLKTKVFLINWREITKHGPWHGLWQTDSSVLDFTEPSFQPMQTNGTSFTLKSKDNCAGETLVQPRPLTLQQQKRLKYAKTIHSSDLYAFGASCYSTFWTDNFCFGELRRWSS